MKFINLTRRTEIGANSYYLEADGARLILDCGMHPKDEGEFALPDWRPIDGRAIDAILISHAHQDHIGTLPVLMRRQPRARVFMPEATGEIGRVLLHNSVNVMMRQREELGLTLYPLFTHRETNASATSGTFARTASRLPLMASDANDRDRLRLRVLGRGPCAWLVRHCPARGRPHGFLYRRCKLRCSDGDAGRGFSRERNRCAHYGMHPR